MAQTDTAGDRNRIVKLALAGVAALVAVRALRRGNKATGVLAGLGAVALGYTARAGSESEEADVDIDTPRAGTSTDDDTSTTVETTTSEPEARLRCAACGDPIVPGQRRGPDEQDRTVHEACLQAAA